MAPSKSGSVARRGATTSASKRARSHRHEDDYYASTSRPARSKPVSKSITWRDGQIDSDHDQTPSKLHQPRSGTGEASHRHRSPERSNISGPEKQLQAEECDDDVPYDSDETPPGGGLIRTRGSQASVEDETPSAGRSPTKNLLGKPENAQVVRYIGCLAIGGPKGEDGWAELLADQGCRKALVVGIIGRALKEHVFGSLWFGATAEQLTRLEDMERSRVMMDKDGFSRTKMRAEVVKGFAASEDDVEFAINKINLQLSSMLAPFWQQATRVPPSVHWKLKQIVRKAAEASRAMRQQEDVVYYWPPTFKDEEFEPARMECYNLNEMISHSPYDKTKVQGKFERAMLREGEEQRSEAIVRVVCFPGLVAYRQHGGDMAVEEMQADERENSHAPEDVRRARMRFGEKLDVNHGFRSRVLCKSVVQLQWGQQRLLTREAGTSAHIDAVKAGNMRRYEDDSKAFRELHHLFDARHGRTTTTHRAGRSST
ncbi:uncharacterized protein MYCFIDRAFT_90185 [Pseudocercospora fijiensis CIRAD86]|uniref:Uncharacterized protein n=1 Tax=Pseudocercospora fijiensis (strain CIRAD86) TaxID=383855 RepID=M3AED5_PSEFD|nr:uncharacterized protein MYCFIDRAFT_90185 [Pseudocercospora fijiensis CIRAD86]EME82946.1 hypothetical protein MYCFIDRAFT_90185 [Pseudocercospora fijiensis CIRAD86]